MRHGQMDGIWYFYYIDGRENYKIQFKDGKIIGKFIYYGADGEVLWDRESL
jgi:antitoxin component YwqK of YwqJK toxin-antitoxin module